MRILICITLLLLPAFVFAAEGCKVVESEESIEVVCEGDGKSVPPADGKKQNARPQASISEQQEAQPASDTPAPEAKKQSTPDQPAATTGLADNRPPSASGASTIPRQRQNLAERQAAAQARKEYIMQQRSTMQNSGTK